MTESQALGGQVGIVTGGSSGIGAAIVTAAIEGGAQIAFSSRRPPPPGSSKGEFFQADMRRFEEAERLCGVVRDRFGRIDFVVASAGLTLQESMDGGDPDTWRALVETNLLGVAFVVRAALPAMIEQGQGHVVLLGSVAGRGTHAGESVYLASKWTIVGLAEALRQELKVHKVRVSLIEPGIVDTPMIRNSPGASAWLAAIEPLQPVDIAKAVLFALCQPARVSVNDIILRPSEQEL